MKTNIDWNKIYKEIGVEFAKEFNWVFMDNFKGEINKFTPFKTGQLALTAYVPRTSNEHGGQIIYPAEYALFVYNMLGVNWTKDSHPQATGQWDKQIPDATVQATADKVARMIINKYTGRVK